MSRFSEPNDPIFRQLDSSIGYDRRLGPHDVAQSRAHATMLAAAGIIGEDERDTLLSGLDQVAAELEGGTFPFAPDDVDIHMAVERRLTDLVGPVGGKLHTARSRNDQVATDLVLFTRAHAEAALAGIARAARDAASTLAERHLDWAMPGYTHLQRAQPVYLSHHLLAYFWMLGRDAKRFAFVREATEELPLGAGALAGVNFDTDRGLLASQLGFERVAPNSIDAVSNRDFVLDYLSAAAICATHLSRLGAELVLWSSDEFGFCEVVRRLGVGLVDHAAEEEPRRRRAAAREGAADRRPPDRPPRRHARPAADLQQGPAGGQGAPVRRRRHARAVARGGDRDAERDRASTASASPRPPPTS